MTHTSDRTEKDPQERTPVVVFDLDGVLADHRHRLSMIRGRKQWERYFAASERDALSPRGERVLQEWCELGELVLLTGRPRRLKRSTEAWLGRNVIASYTLLMRGDDDQRSSELFKLSELKQLMRAHEVLVVVDDEPAVIRAAKGLGLNTLLATWAGRR